MPLKHLSYIKAQEYFVRFSSQVNHQVGLSIFEVRHPRCVNQTTKLKSIRLKVKTQLYYIYIYIYIYQTMVTANNYTFRPLTGHHRFVHLMKRAEGCKIYNIHCILYSPQPFSLDVHPEDDLLEAETCSC